MIDEKSVFNAARRIGDAAERERYLEVACGTDAEALARIRELLRVHEQEGSFLESPAAPEPPLESPGATVGPYKLLEQIGEGGFGVVFMAEQTAPVKRRVALKVIEPRDHLSRVHPLRRIIREEEPATPGCRTRSASAGRGSGPTCGTSWTARRGRTSRLAIWR